MKVWNFDNNLAIAFGLSWRAVDPLESWRDQLSTWRADGFLWMAAYSTGDGDSVVGLAKDEGLSDAGRRRVYAGAALIAQHRDILGSTALIGIPMGEVKILIGLIKGVVIFDDAVTAQQEAATRSSFVAKCTEAGVEGRFLDLEEFNAASFLPSTSWKDVLTLKKAGNARARIQKLDNERTTKLLAAMLTVGVLAAAAVYAKSWYQEREQLAALQLQEQASNPDTRYATSISRLLGDRNALAPVGTTARAFHAALTEMGHLLQAGWMFKSAACESRSGDCLVTWTRMEPSLGTFDEFRRSASTKWQDMTFSEDLQQLSFKLHVQIQRQPFPDRDAWPTMQQLLTEEGSRWQRYSILGFRIELKPPGVEGLPAGMQPSQLLNSGGLVYAASWSQAEAPYFLSEVLETTSNQLMHLESYTVNFNGRELTSKAEGKIYVRK